MALEEMVEEMVSFRIVPLESREPEEVVAMEELLLNLAYQNEQPIASFNIWNKPTISISKFQTLRDVNEEACNEQGVKIVRTNVGGRTVYHHPEVSLSFCIAIPRIVIPSFIYDSPERLYQLFLKNFVSGLVMAGVPAKIKDKNYIFVEDKLAISSTALHKEQEKGVLLHGILFYDLKVKKRRYIDALLSLVNNPPKEQHEVYKKYLKQALTSVLEYISLSREAVCDFIASAFSKDREVKPLDPKEKEMLNSLSKRYRDPNWYVPEVQRAMGICFKAPENSIRGFEARVA